MSGAKALMDRIFSRIKHGDDAHREWLQEELKVMAEELDKNWLILDPVQKAKMVDGMKTYIKYADGYIGFQKARSGQFDMTEEEKMISPAIVEAMTMLGLKEK